MRVIPFICCMAMAICAGLHDPLIGITLSVFVIVIDQAIEAYKKERQP